MDEEGEYLSSAFYYPEDLETFDVDTETGISESQEAIDDFHMNKQKSANTNKKTTSDMNTLLRYVEANGMANERNESLPASELDRDIAMALRARKVSAAFEKRARLYSCDSLDILRKTTLFVVHLYRGYP